MRKINPKVTKLAIMLLTLLIAGGTALAIREGAGEPSIGDGSEDGDGNT